MARSGLDWLLIDMEHGRNRPRVRAFDDRRNSRDACRAGCSARVAANVPWLAKPLMDAGVLGVAFPMVCSKAEAESAARALHYPPSGEHMWGPLFAPDALGRADARLHARSRGGIVVVRRRDRARRRGEAIDEIVEARGVDVAIIGPGDLATSFGRHGQVDRPDVQAAIREPSAAFLPARSHWAGWPSRRSTPIRMIETGYRIIALGFDWSLLQKGIAAAVSGIQR